MQKMLLAVIVLFVSAVCHAHTTKCHLALSYGVAKVHELGTTKAEDRLLAENYIVGSYKTNSKSNPYEFAVGCDLNRYFGIQIGHREGLKAQVDSKFSFVGNILGEPVKTELVDVKRFAELSGYSVAFTGQMQLYGPLYLTGELGAMYGKAFIAATSPKIPYEIEATRRIEGVVPIGGLGLKYKASDRLALGIKGEAYGRYVSIVSGYVEIGF